MSERVGIIERASESVGSAHLPSEGYSLDVSRQQRR